LSIFKLQGDGCKSKANSLRQFDGRQTSLEELMSLSDQYLPIGQDVNLSPSPP